MSHKFVIYFTSIYILESLNRHRSELTNIFHAYIVFRGILSLISIFLSSTPSISTVAQHVAVDEVSREKENIVTAQKTEKLHIDVTLTIAAVIGIRLGEIVVDGLDKLSNYVSGLNIQEQSGNKPDIVVRGITSGSGSACQAARISVCRMLMTLRLQLRSGALRTLRLFDPCDIFTVHSFCRIS